MSNAQQRDSLRLEKQALRLTLSEQQLSNAAHALQQRCLPYISTKTCIAGYQAVKGEISVDGILQHARNSGAVTALPIVKGETLLFAPFDEHTSMVKKRFGLLEPDIAEEQYLQPSQMDCILVPLVAFDENANRMGMGGGFYDKSFAFKRDGEKLPTMIGVAHEIQKAESVFHEWWDVPLDHVVTDENVYHRKNAE